MRRVNVILNDPTIHCVDVTDGAGERIIRIRPHREFVEMKSYNDGMSASLSREDCEELSDAFARLARSVSLPEPPEGRNE